MLISWIWVHLELHSSYFNFCEVPITWDSRIAKKFCFASCCCHCSEVCLEYTQRMRKVAGELLKGISKSLGLEEWYIDKTMNMDSGLQILTVNLYPPCPQPEYAMGLPPHSDHSFLTLLIQNGIGGLQVQHKGQWFDVNPIPNSILVNTGDHLEVPSYLAYSVVSIQILVLRFGFLTWNNVCFGNLFLKSMIILSKNGQKKVWEDSFTLPFVDLRLYLVYDMTYSICNQTYDMINGRMYYPISFFFVDSTWNMIILSWNMRYTQHSIINLFFLYIFFFFFFKFLYYTFCKRVNFNWKIKFVV